MTAAPWCVVALLAAGAAHAQNTAPAHETLPAAPDFARPASLELGRFDDPAIRTAIREAAAAAPHDLPAAGANVVFSGRAAKRVDAAFEAAAVGDCLHGDALKHTPPVIRIGPIPLGLGGIFAVPFWAYAAASRKCR